MTKKTEINTLKTLAKRYARANRIPQHEALNAIATELDFAHWTQLATGAKQGWLSSAEQLTRAEVFVRQSHPGVGEKDRFIDKSFSRPVDEPIRQGKIGGHAYRVFETLGDIRVEGDGWRIIVSEALYSQPVVEIEKPHADTSPVRKHDFLDAALVIAEMPMICSSEKRLRFMLWSSVGQNELQSGLNPRGNVSRSSAAGEFDHFRAWLQAKASAVAALAGLCISGSICERISFALSGSLKASC